MIVVLLYCLLAASQGFPMQIGTNRRPGSLKRAMHKRAIVPDATYTSTGHTSSSQALGMLLFVLSQAARLHESRYNRNIASKSSGKRFSRVVRLSSQRLQLESERGDDNSNNVMKRARHDTAISQEVMSTTLSSGQVAPMIGLGTWKSKPGEVRAAVETAIEQGYRHIDCAPIYGNEKEVGEALRAKVGQVVQREDLFIVSKLWNTEHRKEHVRAACEKTLHDLNLEYLDLYLMHWPFAFQHGGEMIPRRQDGSVLYDEDTDYVETWAAMEELVAEGLVRAIGVCNFNSSQVKRIMEMCTVKPATNQVESNPYFDQSDLQRTCAEYGIPLTAYCPLGSSDNPARKDTDPVLLEDEVLTHIAKKHGKSSAQVCIRWQIQRGLIVLPKSVNPRRIGENLDVWNFELDRDDMAAIAKLNRNWRLNDCVININGELKRRDAAHKYYPFTDHSDISS